MHHLLLLLLSISQPSSDIPGGFCRRAVAEVPKKNFPAEMPINFEPTTEFWRRRLDGLSDPDWAQLGLRVFMPQVAMERGPKPKWTPYLTSRTMLKVESEYESGGSSVVVIKVAMPEESRRGYIEIPEGRISKVAGQPIVGMTESGTRILWIPSWNNPPGRPGEIVRSLIGYHEYRSVDDSGTGPGWPNASHSILEVKIGRGDDQVALPVFNFKTEETKVFGLVVAGTKVGVNNGSMTPDKTKLILLNPGKEKTSASSVDLQNLISGAYRIVPLGPEIIKRGRPTDGVNISSYLVAIVPEATTSKENIYFARINFSGEVQILDQQKIGPVSSFNLTEDHSKNEFSGRVPHIKVMRGKQVLMVPTQRKWTAIPIPAKSKIRFEPRIDEELPSGPHFYPQNLTSVTW